MCDCRKDIEAALVERLKAARPDATDHKVRLEGYGIAVKNLNLMEIISMPVQQEYTILTKGRQLPKVKSERTSLTFSYCPFCGEKLAKE